MHALLRLENHVFKCWGPGEFHRSQRKYHPGELKSQKQRLSTHPLPSEEWGT